MVAILERKWKEPVKYTCWSCLCKAYRDLIEDERDTGHVSDEELIESSHHTLRHL
jgi:hypothetical protein